MLTTIRLNNRADRLHSLWNLFDDLELDHSNPDHKETKDGYQFEVNLAGTKREDIKVSLEDGLLKVTSEKGGTKYAKNFQVPKKADTSSPVARYEDGILYLKINKKQESKPVDIKIN
jgi:HSP20 family protein